MQSKILKQSPYYTLFDEYTETTVDVLSAIQDALLTPASVDDGVLFYDALDQVVSDDLDDVIDCCVYAAHYHHYVVHTADTVPSPQMIVPNAPNYKSLRPYFGYHHPADTIIKLLRTPICSYAYEHVSHEAFQVSLSRTLCPLS